MLFGKKSKYDLKIDGMHCEKCVARVEEALKALGGSARIDLKLGRASVTVPEKISADAVIAAVEALGFSCRKL